MEMKLKVKIIESGRKSYEVAHSLGWHPSKLSHIINGAMKPSPGDRAKIASELGVDVAEVFYRKKGTMAKKCKGDVVRSGKDRREPCYQPGRRITD